MPSAQVDGRHLHLNGNKYIDARPDLPTRVHGRPRDESCRRPERAIQARDAEGRYNNLL